MRLSRIKVAGFKSFVDPTTLDLPSNLVGIVGPNGCGKSNVIDAVRWVMGESSARHLRGESMDDVIFNGSASRKPVVQASVELVFDNSDGVLGGEYARYNEISVRRRVTRDGQSVYYLNGSRCRRRDITDLFLGTGLGPRSYAIIEQGMISRLVEAKPQELRVYLEEAAGISKYKERRRETENRIRHTRDNLDRLTDLREEIDKQLRHLKRQAETAERYKALKAEERRAAAELLALRLGELDVALAAQAAELTRQQTELERRLAAVREVEARIEALREQAISAREAFEAEQAAFYQVGGEITNVEQDIRHQRELLARRRQEHDELRQALARSEAAIRQDAARLDALDAELARLAPELETREAALAEAREVREQAERAMADWQQRWEAHRQAASRPLQVAQVEKARMEQLQRRLDDLARRAERLRREQAELSGEEGDDEALASLEDSVARAAIEQQSLQRTLDDTGARIRRHREALRREREALAERQQAAQSLRGRLASLEALQQAALGKDQQAAGEWLRAHGLDEAPRVGEHIEASAPWAAVVEQVLGDVLEAVVVERLATHVPALPELRRGHLLLAEADPQADAAPAPGTLWSQVRAPASLRPLLASVYLAETVEEALARRETLAPHESVITPDGLWLGRHWARMRRETDEHAGLLARNREIETLQRQLRDLDADIATREAAILAHRETIQALEKVREEEQAAVRQFHREFAELQARLGRAQSRHEHRQRRRESIARELAEIDAELAAERVALAAATEARNAALAEAEALGGEGEALQAERAEREAALGAAREAVEELAAAHHALQLQLARLRADRQATAAGLARARAQAEDTRRRLETLAADLAGGEAPIEALRAELERLLARRLAVEQAMQQRRERLQSIEHDLREAERRRHALEAEYGAGRDALEALRVRAGELTARRQSLLEQFEATGLALEAVRETLPANATPADWTQRLEALARRIQRLGPINLAAIDEYREQSERKRYLDAQDADLRQALDTLERAIDKIDRETRARFKATFEQVNARLGEMFPTLFGGGQAFLELTEDNLLTTGVSIMARPPGKRISSIHLMSGGEKALTAVALVFAIFELNPAPFCMLDEVDAPLDEANVGRFCELVRKMSDRVQFIFITHNKVTMELAHQLIGVTMREAGVSRLVNVDIDEAARMATTG